MSSLFDSGKQSSSLGRPGAHHDSAQDASFQSQLNEMNQSAIKLGALIMKLENLVETNPAFKTGDQAALMQMSLVKE